MGLVVSPNLRIQTRDWLPHTICNPISWANKKGYQTGPECKKRRRILSLSPNFKKKRPPLTTPHQAHLPTLFIFVHNGIRPVTTAFGNVYQIRKKWLQNWAKNEDYIRSLKSFYHLPFHFLLFYPPSMQCFLPLYGLLRP